MLVSMYESLLNPSRSITNKADAMQFAILLTMQHNGCHEQAKVDYDEAEKLFKFICDHVEFTEDKTKDVIGGFLPILEGLIVGKAGVQDKDETCVMSK